MSPLSDLFEKDTQNHVCTYDLKAEAKMSGRVKESGGKTWGAKGSSKQWDHYSKKWTKNE